MHQLNGHMYIVVNSQPEVCERLIWLRAHFYINHLISDVCQIKIDIEHLEVYVHKKNGLEDPFFRRLKLIT